MGLSIGIVKDGQMVYSNGYGYTDPGSLHKISNETRFNIASITKLFTATAVLQLVEQGKLDISRPLIDYLPDFKLKDRRFKSITVFQLLTHSSGLPWDKELKTPTTDSIALHELVLSLRKTKLKFNPGSKFNGSTYSNTGYDVLGYLIQKTAGISFEKYIENQILAKLEMNNSVYSRSRIPDSLLAQPLKVGGTSKEIVRFNLYGEIKRLNPVLKYTDIPIDKWESTASHPEHYPSSFLYSSAKDLSKWMIECLNTYNNDGQLLLSATLKNMWALQGSIKGSNTSIGLGWWRFSNSVNGEYVFHVGREPGYCSTLRIYPDKNTGVVILCNAYYASGLIWNELPERIIELINKE